MRAVGGERSSTAKLRYLIKNFVVGRVFGFVGVPAEGQFAVGAAHAGLCCSGLKGGRQSQLASAVTGRAMLADKPYNCNPAKLTRTLKPVSGGRLMALNYVLFFRVLLLKFESDSVNQERES